MASKTTHTPLNPRNKILALSSYQSTSVAPVEKMDDSPIIPYFKENGNTFPSQLVDMFERGGIHRAAIHIKHRLACGDGLIIERRDGEPYIENLVLEDWLNEVNGNQTAYEVICDQLMDTVIFNIVAGQVAGKGTSTTVHHEDASTVRWAKPTGNGLEYAYISNMWGEKELKKPTEKTLTEFAEKLPLFDGGTEPSLLIVKNYQPSRKYYPVPDYFSLSAKRWIEIEYKIPTYNDSRIDQKFMPSGILTMYGDPPADMTPLQYTNRIIQEFSGEGNNSKLITQLVSNKESAPDWTPLNDEPDGIFLNLDTLAQQSVLRAHRMHPMFLMATAGSLGQSSEIKTLFDVYYSSVIKGYQDMVIKFWNKVLKQAGFEEYTLSIANNNPVSLLGNLDISKYLSPNEIRKLLGYDPMDIEKPVNEQNIIAVVTNPSIKVSEKRAILEFIYGLEIEQIDRLVPQMAEL